MICNVNTISEVTDEILYGQLKNFLQVYLALVDIPCFLSITYQQCTIKQSNADVKPSFKMFLSLL